MGQAQRAGLARVQPVRRREARAHPGELAALRRAAGRPAPRAVRSGRCRRRRRCRRSRRRAAAATRRPAAHAQRVAPRCSPLGLQQHRAGRARRVAGAAQVHAGGRPSPRPARRGGCRRWRVSSTTRPARITVTASHRRHDLLELVRDQQDRRAALAQAAQRGEELLGLLRRQHGGGLVEDQDARAAVQRLQDLQPLALADRQVGDRACPAPPAGRCRCISASSRCARGLGARGRRRQAARRRASRCPAR